MACRAIAVGGMVQGAGLRPFIYGSASWLGLHGFVRNQTDGVLIEVEEEPGVLDHFLLELTEKPPPRARINRVQWVSQCASG
jgi:hydrogenase maturation protein HypF